MSDLVPRSELNKRALQGVVATGGGIATLILAAVTRGHWAGIIIGAVVGVVGLAFSGSKSKTERTGGIISAVVGAGLVLSSIPVLGGLFGWVHGVLYAGGIVLLGAGVVSLFRFFSGLRKRM